MIGLVLLVLFSGCGNKVDDIENSTNTGKEIVNKEIVDNASDKVVIDDNTDFDGSLIEDEEVEIGELI